MALDRDNLPLQTKIKQILRDEIARGVWGQGMQVPPEPELMRRFGVSRITVSQALRDLANDGLVVRRQGKGTYVSSHPQGWTNLGALLQRTPSQGGDLDHALNRVECVVPPSDIATDLQLGPDDRTWTFTRLKMIDGNPLQWEQGYIPASLVTADLDADDQAQWGKHYFVDILFQLTGHRARRCRAFLQAVHLDERIANVTGELAGKPAIEVTRLWHSEVGLPVLLTRSVLRPDGTRYYVDLPDIPQKGRDEM